MILRFYFDQVRETRGSIIKIVRPTDLSYIKGDRRESITETYEKWNMRQLEGYYGITFVIDVIFNRNICNIIYEGEILLICLVRPTTKNEKITQYDMNTHKTVLILKKRSVQMCPQLAMIYKMFVKHTSLFILGQRFFMYLIDVLEER